MSALDLLALAPAAPAAPPVVLTAEPVPSAAGEAEFAGMIESATRRAEASAAGTAAAPSPGLRRLDAPLLSAQTVPEPVPEDTPADPASGSAPRPAGNAAAHDALTGSLAEAATGDDRKTGQAEAPETAAGPSLPDPFVPIPPVPAPPDPVASNPAAPTPAYPTTAEASSAEVSAPIPASTAPPGDDTAGLAASREATTPSSERAPATKPEVSTSAEPGAEASSRPPPAPPTAPHPTGAAVATSVPAQTAQLLAAAGLIRLDARSGPGSPPPPSDDAGPSPTLLQAETAGADGPHATGAPSRTGLLNPDTARTQATDAAPAANTPPADSATTVGEARAETAGDPTAVTAAVTAQTSMTPAIGADLPDLGSTAAAPIGAPLSEAIEFSNAPRAAVSASLSTAETTVALADQIARRVSGRSTRFEIGLTPDGLGRVDVTLNIGADGALTAELAFDTPQAAGELRGRAEELRRQLQDAGFTLSRDALSFAERDTGQSGGGNSRSSREFLAESARAFAGAGRLTEAAETVLALPAWAARSLTPSGVDVKV